jgi:hypothetical protein
MTVTIGKLVDVSPRLAWQREASDFTPWLKANLDRLSEIIGISLEAVDHEVRVDQFRADILARNPVDQSLVLIENQLEGGNHTHLGQILTYLAGLNVQTVVWVATEFENAHLSAMRWLNEHTVEPFSFFAIKLRLVQIGASEVAPLFEIIEQPNQWDRRLQATARQSQDGTAIGNRRRAFWRHYFSKFPTEGDAEEDYGHPTRWLDVLDKPLLLAQYASTGATGVFVRKPWKGSDAEAIEFLMPYKDDLERVLGAPMGAGSYLFNRELKLDLSDGKNWDRAADWLKEQTDLYVKTLTDVLGKAK